MNVDIFPLKIWEVFMPDHEQIVKNAIDKILPLFDEEMRSFRSQNPIMSFRKAFFLSLDAL